MRTTTRRNTLDIALDVLRCYALAQDADRWITVKPNGEEEKGRPVLIESETGEIKAGMGGKFTGKKLSELPQSKNPHPITEAKWQARQKRLAEKQAVKGGLQEGHKAFPKRHAIKGEAEELGHKYYIVDNPLYQKAKELQEKLGEKQFRKQVPQDIQRMLDDGVTELKLRQDKVSVENGDIVGGNPQYGQYGRFSRDLDMEGAEIEQKAARSERMTKAAAERKVKEEAAKQERIKASAPDTDEHGRPVAPKRPEGVPDGYWNGKVYSGNRVYIDGREIKLTKEKVEALQKWQNDYAEYKKARETDTKAAPKQYLDVAYEDRDEAKAAGARWDPSVKKWYWDKRDGDMPEALNEVSGRRQRQWQQEREERARQRDAQERQQREEERKAGVSTTVVLGRYNEGDVTQIDGQWVRVEKVGKRQKIDENMPSVYGARLLGHEGDWGTEVKIRPASESEIRSAKEEGARSRHGNAANTIPGLKELYGTSGQERKNLLAQYPHAAAYLKAEKEAYSANYELAAIGRKALERVKAGDWQGAMEEMEKEKNAFLERHIWDSAPRPIAMDFDLAMDADNPANYPEMRGASGGHLALDRSSVRTVDENGYMHVKSSHITKATVNPYYGREIPGWREEGLDPDKVYYGLRDPEELKKSVPTWAGLPLHIEHHIDSAEDPQKLTRVGTVGTEIRWNEPYIDAPLTVWDQTAIDGIEDGSFRELSCAYRYEPDFTPGTWNGKRYDFVMRNIRGNHVALVEEGRAGSDVLVADAKPAAMRRRNVLDVALDVLRGYALAMDEERWITVKPNGEEGKGRPVLIEGSTGEIKAGMGGKFNGRSIDDVPRGKNPHPVTEAKYQARQQRERRKQAEALIDEHKFTYSKGPDGKETMRHARYGVTRGNYLDPKEAAPLRDTILEVLREREAAKSKETAQPAQTQPAPSPVERPALSERTWKKPGKSTFDGDPNKRYKVSLNGGEADGYTNGSIVFFGFTPESMEKHPVEQKDGKDYVFSMTLESNPDGTVTSKRGQVSDEQKFNRELTYQGVKGDENHKVAVALFSNPKNSEYATSISDRYLNSIMYYAKKRHGKDADVKFLQGEPDRFSNRERGHIQPIVATVNGEPFAFFMPMNTLYRPDGSQAPRRPVSFGDPSYRSQPAAPTEPARPPGPKSGERLKTNSDRTIQVGGEYARSVGKATWQDAFGGGKRGVDKEAVLGYAHTRAAEENEPQFVYPSKYRKKDYWAAMSPSGYWGPWESEQRKSPNSTGYVVYPDGSVYQAQVNFGKDSALDGAIGGQKHKKREGLMSRFMKWFRGAQDGDPAVEKKEVDLAQAIIDLHRKDPVTGEIRDDVSEDADKAAEVRVLVERLKGKIPPEDYERLFGAIAALAAEEEAQDEEGGQLMFEETKGREEEGRENIHADAMRAAGCDAEDPDEARAFAGGVKYGEELERNPAEREKLDREHESEGMRRAMDACGVDAENPSETKAFAEGVKYGEENARQKAEDEDPEDEDKPVGDEDKNAMIDKILAAVPDLTDEQKKKIADTLSDLAYSPATGDEELEKKVEGAADRAFRKRRFLGATDAARIRAQATSDAMARMRDIAEACRVVRPLVGEMDSLAFDSANDVYGYTLEQMGKRPRKYDRRAWRGMVEMLLDNHAALATDAALRAREAKRIPDAGPFRFLKNITVG